MDYSPSSLFNTIAPTRIPWNHWLTSLAIHIALVFVFIAIPVAVDRGLTETSHYAAVRLEDPRISPPPIIKTPIIKALAIKAPVIQRAPIKTAPILLTRTIPPIKLIAEPPPLIPAPVDVRAPDPKLEIPALLTPPKPIVVKTEVFAAADTAPAGPKPAAREVKPGGFGDPAGVPAAAPSKGLVVAKVGAFDLPSGSGQGGAAGHAKVVAMAGFGDTGSFGSATGGIPTGSHAGTPVRPAGFGDYTSPSAPTNPGKTAAPASPAITPVEITYKPKPIYTPEARQQKIEGEVQLDVVFSATGQVHVLRVLRGLGLGLDESARAAASQIRFRPSTKDGSPVDMRGIVHIVFELS